MRSLIVALHLWAASVLADSLLATLEDNGFTEFAKRLQALGRPLLDAGPDLVVYAPTNAALARQEAGTDPLRRLGRGDKEQAGAQIKVARDTARKDDDPRKNPKGNSTKFGRDYHELHGRVMVTFLNDPDYANLGPGINQTVIEARAAYSRLPLVFSGLGASVRVSGEDIPYSHGVIRPIDGLVLTALRLFG